MKPLPSAPNVLLPDLLTFPSIHILGVDVHALPRWTVKETCRNLMLSGRPHQVITANSLLVLEAQKSAPLRQVCDEAALVLADSSGLCWAARRLGQPLDRIPGVDLAYQLCETADQVGVPVYLLGGKPGVSGQAARYLCRQFPSLHVAGMRDGFFRPEDETAIIRDITESRSRLVLVALGMPKQDIWIHRNLHRLPPALYIGVGGSFDVWTGRVKRAPLWFQKTGMEWLFRWGQEPARWRRIAQLPVFALRVIQQSEGRRGSESPSETGEI